MNNKFYQNERGVAFIELALVIPVLMIALAGILKIGSIVSQLPYLFQISFDTAYLASATGDLSPAQNTLVENRAHNLYEIKSHEFDIDSTFNYTTNSSDRTATLALDAQFRNLLTFYSPFTIANRITLAQMVNPPDLSTWVTRSNF